MPLSRDIVSEPIIFSENYVEQKTKKAWRLETLSGMECSSFFFYFFLGCHTFPVVYVIAKNF